MTDEEVKHVFEPYYRDYRSPELNPLINRIELSISKQICLSLGGEMSVESDSKGT